jgi:hypothetical protein
VLARSPDNAEVRQIYDRLKAAPPG